ncbi:hypothetical protein B0T21DRAFT_350783 [Apiosordaria backusii]|uniref:Uncharacterized protein n=1 Tax=Apiosordaria backusii TaxID=314023 RepID=A0AA40B306_9PEZI|nr:hypothetical protein B0T21DRAFT_350783 [Apiosordaria backusii]
MCTFVEVFYEGLIDGKPVCKDANCHDNHPTCVWICAPAIFQSRRYGGYGTSYPCLDEFSIEIAIPLPCWPHVTQKLEEKGIIEDWKSTRDNTPDKTRKKKKIDTLTAEVEARIREYLSTRQERFCADYVDLKDRCNSRFGAFTRGSGGAQSLVNDFEFQIFDRFCDDIRAARRYFKDKSKNGVREQCPYNQQPKRVQKLFWRDKP